MSRLWFMDIDGVMAPFGKGGAYRDWIRSPHDRYELWLSPAQAGRIRNILVETRTELIWVSTWAHEAAEYIERVLGWSKHRFAALPHPDIKGGDRGPSGRWWKLEAVEAFLAELEPDRFVWSDDDHARHRTAVARSLARFDASPLIQCPKPHVGLSERWLREAHDHLMAPVQDDAATSPT
jgi:hypothetical protein